MPCLVIGQDQQQVLASQPIFWCDGWAP